MAAPAGADHEAPLHASRREKRKKKPDTGSNPAPVHQAAAQRRVNELEIEAGEVDQIGSTALMHPTKLAELGMMEGDIVRLKGKRDRETLCTLQASSKIAGGAIGISAVTRANLKLGIGETTKAYRCLPQQMRFFPTLSDTGHPI